MCASTRETACIHVGGYTGLLNVTFRQRYSLTVLVIVVVVVVEYQRMLLRHDPNNLRGGTYARIQESREYEIKFLKHRIVID